MSCSALSKLGNSDLEENGKSAFRHLCGCFFVRHAQRRGKTQSSSICFPYQEQDSFCKIWINYLSTFWRCSDRRETLWRTESRPGKWGIFKHKKTRTMSWVKNGRHLLGKPKTFLLWILRKVRTIACALDTIKWMLLKMCISAVRC